MISHLAHPNRPERCHARLDTGATSHRFTVDGDGGLEKHLAHTCDRITAGLMGLLPRQRLQAALLGGGYGRGEGGVLRTSGGDRPYNDLEFYILLRGNRHWNQRLYGHALHVFGEILTPQAGVDVEFRITSLPELENSRVSMFSYDLVCRHQWLLGNDALLAGCAHHRVAEDIPLFEATRLLMNRCSGLLFARERIARADFGSADADFVARNIAKAQLGAGDAVLTALHQYHWSVRERFRRMQRLGPVPDADGFPDVCEHHLAGVEFKLHPTRSTATRKELASLLAKVGEVCRKVWFWLESRRLGRHFGSVEDYADSDHAKCPDVVGIRAFLINTSFFGPRALVTEHPFRHPRERVLTTLPLLLWHPAPLTTPAVLHRIQLQLQTNASSPCGIVAAYRRLWERVN